MSVFTFHISVQTRIFNSQARTRFADVKKEEVILNFILFMHWNKSLLLISYHIISSRRKWHRLYSTKLYTVEVSDAVDSLACTMNVLCDVGNCAVNFKPGDLPFAFTITTKEQQKIELQV